MDRIWLKHYPSTVPAEIDVNEFRSIGDLFLKSAKQYAARDAYINMGKNYGLKPAHMVRPVQAAVEQTAWEAMLATYRSARDKHGLHEYDPSEFGLDREELREYYRFYSDRFQVPASNK